MCGRWLAGQHLIFRAHDFDDLVVSWPKCRRRTAVLDQRERCRAGRESERRALAARPSPADEGTRFASGRMGG
jgi:hypothetical protein